MNDKNGGRTGSKEPAWDANAPAGALTQDGAITWMKDPVSTEDDRNEITAREDRALVVAALLASAAWAALMIFAPSLARLVHLRLFGN
jgi:hypothetical protein